MWIASQRASASGGAAARLEENAEFSHGRPPRLRNRRGRPVRCRNRRPASWRRAGGVEAAEQALLAVRASLRVLLGIDARLAGVEVLGERGQHLAQLTDLRFEALGFQLRWLGRTPLWDSYPRRPRSLPGRTLAKATAARCGS